MVGTKSGPMFLNVVNMVGHTMNKYYITGKLMDYIKNVGHQNMVQIILDNAQTCN